MQYLLIVVFFDIEENYASKAIYNFSYYHVFSINGDRLHFQRIVEHAL